jgi:ACT domain-containing protein
MAGVRILENSPAGAGDSHHYQYAELICHFMRGAPNKILTRHVAVCQICGAIAANIIAAAKEML